VRAATPTHGDHILIYTTSGYDTLNDVAKTFPNERFIVYGSGRDDREANLQFKLPSRDGFLDDLLAAKGVMATAGFTLISESLYLGKPYLALPIAGQFEQQLNAWQLEQSGYGARAGSDLRASVAQFLKTLPEIASRVAEAPRNDGSAFRAKVLELIEEHAR
jgi:uncharacterized protein (TIGR00661 family)